MQVILTPPPFDCLAAMYKMPSLHFSSGGSNASDPEVLAMQDASGEEKQGRPRALVVDDAPDVTEMIAMFLEHAGYDAVMAFSATEALKVVEQAHFDVIVSDIGMPGMSGYEVARELRLEFGKTRPLLIAITGWKQSSDRILARLAGFDHHVAKPCDPAQLLELIAPLANGSSAA